MPIDQILLGGAAIVGGFFLVQLLLPRAKRAAAQAPAIFNPPPQPAPVSVDPMDDLAQRMDREASRRRVQVWYTTAVDTLANRDTRDVAAGYSTVANPPSASAPEAPRPN